MQAHMPNRKLQVFVSSTYSDLVPERLAAIEAILAAGHIPAAMEQFTPGDETAWEKIQRWIDESDAFMLVLAGRYGSIEPMSGKSYVQLEYEYARSKNKPFFSLVLADDARDARVRAGGLAVIEENNPLDHKAFEQKVLEHHCAFWKDSRDIQASIFKKLPEWAQRIDLVGWVRGDQATAVAVEELSRLSSENRQLRERVAAETGLFEGLTFQQVLAELSEIEVEDLNAADREIFHLSSAHRVHNMADLLRAIADPLTEGIRVDVAGTPDRYLRKVAGFGLAERQVTFSIVLFQFTPLGRRFRNLLKRRL